MTSKSKKVIVSFDITDWAKRYQELERDLSTFEKAMQAQQELGISSEEMAQLLLADRLLGNNQEEIISRDDKGVYSKGGATLYLGRIARAKINELLDNGYSISVREFVGPVKGDENTESPEDEGALEVSTNGKDDTWNGPDMAYVKSEKAVYRAMLYIKKKITGDIYNHFKILAVNRSSVDEAADFLKAEIDTMVARLKG